MKKEEIALVVFSVLFLFSMTMILFQNSKIIGYATEGTTVSNVTISKYLSIDMSANLTSGIYFGNISSLPAVNLNSTNNYDAGLNKSSLLLNVSVDSNTNVDFCIKANEDLLDSVGSNLLAIENETYSNSTSTNRTDPLLGDEVSLDKVSYVKAGENVNEGDGIYYRFWLDIPAAQPSGTYNNTVTFKGVETTLGCGS